MKSQIQNVKTLSPYSNSLDYLFDAFRKLDLVLELAISQRQYQKKNIHDYNKSSYLNDIEQQSDDKIDNHVNLDSIKLLQKNLILEIDKQTKIIQQRLEKNRINNTDLPIQQLQQLFGLTDLEVDILIICLAPQIDERYAKIYTFLYADNKNTYIPIQLIFIILSPSFEDRVKIFSYLFYKSPMIYWQLVHRVEINAHVHYPALLLNHNIANYLIDGSFKEEETDDILEAFDTNFTIEDLYLEKSLKAKLLQLTHLLKHSERDKSHLIYFHGENSDGMQNTIAAIGEELGIKLFKLDASHLVSIAENYWHDVDNSKKKVRKIIRRVILEHSYIALVNADLLLTSDYKISQITRYFFKLIQTVFNKVFLTTTTREFFVKDISSVTPENVYLLDFYFPSPDYQIRSKIWQNYLDANNIVPVNTNAIELSTMFNFAERQIKHAVHSMISKNLLASTNNNEIIKEQLFEHCKSQVQEKMDGLAIKKTCYFSMEDIVLPPETKQQLHELITQRKLHSQVYYQWNFSNKLAGRTGLPALFYGPPGTGKTMAASVIAHELNLELYAIDLSMVISKYIGETEKNLKKIFDTAAELNAILFFDEADALFSKRTEVKDAHDRHANVEVGYLLQRIEAYQGIVILATNLLHNIDEAFVRRFHFYVEFPYPDKIYRKLIWQRIFPSSVPLAENIDYDFLAEKIKLAGGNISNIALKSAFYAAKSNSCVAMSHIIKAAEREYLNLGKMFIRSEYLPYIEQMTE